MGALANKIEENLRLPVDFEWIFEFSFSFVELYHYFLMFSFIMVWII